MRAKNVCAKMTAIVLALLLVQLTAGVTLARCLHTGRLHFVSPTEMAGYSHAAMQTDDDCAGMSGTSMEQQQCMSYSYEQFPASEQAPVFHHDFTAVQPIMFAIWSLMPPFADGFGLPQDVFCPDKVPIPPRAYLAKIRILLI